MSLNHVIATSSFSSATSLGGRVQDANLGAIISNAGLALTVPPAAKTANYTILATDTLIPVNTTGGIVTVTLPAAAATVPPHQGQYFIVLDTGADAGTNNITISAGSGTTLVGSGTISSNSDSRFYIYYGTTYYRIAG